MEKGSAHAGSDKTHRGSARGYMRSAVVLRKEEKVAASNIRVPIEAEPTDYPRCQL